MRFGFKRIAPGPAVILLLLAMTAPRAAQVYLGDEPLEDVAIEPAVVSGEVFVPVRPLIGAMGADLSWDPVGQVLTVRHADDTGTITVGRRAAFIRGRRVFFPRPPFLASGRVYVPILFFTEMFQSAVIWDPVLQRIRIEPVFPGRYPPPRVIYAPPTQRQVEPAPTTEADAGRIRGTAEGVIPSRTSPQIQVRVGGRLMTYPVARGALITRGALGQRGMEVPLGEIRPGDQVALTLNSRGVVQAIRTRYQTMKSHVQSMGPNQLTLDNGVTLDIVPATQIIMPEDVPGSLSDLQVGDSVIVSLTPGTFEAAAIRVLPKTQLSDPGSEAALSLNTTGPLKEGDTLVITFLAYAGGKAAFSIPGVADNVAMTETSPGTYVGEYTVRQGDVLPGSKVTVRYTDPEGRSYSVTSRKPVTIATSGGYLPRIIYPSQGQVVDSPIVVRGIAQPGDTIRVTISYYQDLLGTLPLQGITAIEDVTAGADGTWQTPPMAVTVPWEGAGADVPFDKNWDYGVLEGLYRIPEHPLVFTITAAEIGGGGQAISDYSVTVRKFRGG